MTIRKLLSQDSFVVDPNRRWTREWYDWFSDLLGELPAGTFVEGPTSALDNQWALFDSTTGRLIKAHKRVLLTDLTVYVNEDGDGTGLGLVTGSTAWPNWQPAIDFVDDNIYANGYNVIFQQDPTANFPNTYTAGTDVPIISINQRLSGGGSRIFRGVTSAVDNVRLDASGSGGSGTFGCVDIRQDSGVTIFRDNFRIRCPNGIGISNESFGAVINEGILYIRDVGSNRAYIQINQANSYFQNQGELQFETSTENALRIDSGTFHDNDTISIFGGPTYSGGFYRGDFFSQGYLGANVNGSFTGRRMTMRDRAVLRLFGPIPGSQRGGAEPGCVVSAFGVSENEMRGSATFTGGTTVDVTFAAHGLTGGQFDTNYMVQVEPTENNTFWVANSERLQTGFKIRAASASTATVHFRLFWLPP